MTTRQLRNAVRHQTSEWLRSVLPLLRRDAAVGFRPRILCTIAVIRAELQNRDRGR